MKNKNFLRAGIMVFLLATAVVLFQSQTAAKTKPVQWDYRTVHAQMGADPTGNVFPVGVENLINNEGYELTQIFTIADDSLLPAHYSNVIFVLRKKM